MENERKQIKAAWQICYTVLLSAAYVMLPDSAFAGGAAVAGVLLTDPGVGTSVCDIATFFTGRVATGIGTIAICVLGVGAAVGRITWNQAILVGTGIAIMFGAVTIAANFGPNAACPGA